VTLILIKKHTLSKALAQLIILCVFFAFNTPFSSACSEADSAQTDTNKQASSPCHTADDRTSLASSDKLEDNTYLDCNDCCEKCSYQSYNKSLLKTNLTTGFNLLVSQKLFPHLNNAYASLYLKPLTPPPTT